MENKLSIGYYAHLCYKTAHKPPVSKIKKFFFNKSHNSVTLVTTWKNKENSSKEIICINT